MNWLITAALQMARMSPAEIADISAKLPAAARIAAAAKKAEPILEEMAPLVEKLEPLAEQAYAILKTEWPDIVAVTPTAEQLIEFINSKGN